MSDKTETRMTGMNDVIADALGSGLSLSDAIVLDDKALLVKYGLDDIEQTFSMRDPVTGDLLREKEPCFELLADGFYGSGMHATWYQEGAVIVFPDAPNIHMRPLNRAAALNFARWQESLPQNKVTIEIGDMSEAAVILAKDPRVQHLTPQQAQLATIKVAEGLRLKREGGRNVMDLRAGDINRNFTASSGNRAPPMLGVKMSDMSQLSPGMTRSVVNVSGPGAPVRKAMPAPR